MDWPPGLSTDDRRGSRRLNEAEVEPSGPPLALDVAPLVGAEEANYAHSVFAQSPPQRLQSPSQHPSGANPISISHFSLSVRGRPAYSPQTVSRPFSTAFKAPLSVALFTGDKVTISASRVP